MKIIDSTNAFKINLEAGIASLEGKKEFKIYTSTIAKIFLAVAEFFGCPLMKVKGENGETKFFAFKGAFGAANDLAKGYSAEQVSALIAGVKKPAVVEKTAAEKADEAVKAFEAAQKALDDAKAANANDADVAKLTAELDAAKNAKEVAEKVVADEKEAVEKAAAEKAAEEAPKADAAEKKEEAPAAEQKEEAVEKAAEEAPKAGEAPKAESAEKKEEAPKAEAAEQKEEAPKAEEQKEKVA